MSHDSCQELPVNPGPERGASYMDAEHRPAFSTRNDEANDGHADVAMGEVDRHDLVKAVFGKPIEHQLDILIDVSALPTGNIREVNLLFDVGRLVRRRSGDRFVAAQDLRQILAAALDLRNAALRRL